MRRPLAAILIGVGLVGGLAVWRTPTVALLRLKLALDGQDLTAVEQAIDRHALVQSALGDLADAPAPDPARGTLEPTRAQLGIRLARTLERLVEDPEYRLRVSWADLRATLATLRRTGAVAFFLYRADDGAEYVVRLRRAWARWRVVSVEREGAQALLARPRSNVLAAVPAPPAPGSEEGPAAPTATGTLAALVEPEALAPPVEHVPPPRAPAQPLHAFVRRLDAETWTVQTWSSQDPAAADQHRLALTERGEDAFVLAVKVQGARWYRVLVGRYARAAEAERAALKLAGR